MTLYGIREEALSELAAEKNPGGIFIVFRRKEYDPVRYWGAGKGVTPYVTGISYRQNSRGRSLVSIDNDGVLTKKEFSISSLCDGNLTYSSFDKLLAGLKRNNIKIDITNFYSELVRLKLLPPITLK